METVGPCGLSMISTANYKAVLKINISYFMIERINQRVKSIESSIQRKVEQTTVEELQRKEDIENKIKSIEEGKEIRKSWDDVMETQKRKLWKK